MQAILKPLVYIAPYGLWSAVLLLTAYALKVALPLEGLLAILRYIYAACLASYVVWVASLIGKEFLLVTSQSRAEGNSLRGQKILLVTVLLAAGGLLLANLSFNQGQSRFVLPDLPFFICLLALLGFPAVNFVLRRVLPQSDPFLLPLVALLTGTGLVFLYRLAPELSAIHNKDTALAWLATRQSLWVFLGLGAMLICALGLTDERMHWVSRKKYLWVLLSILLIVFTGLFGKEVNERRLWLEFGPFTLQTVEIVKVVLVFFMAGYFYDEGFTIATREILGVKVPSGLRYVGPYLLMWLLALLPIFLQKDLGPTILLSCLFLIMFYVGSSTASSVLFGFGTLLLGGYVTYQFGWPSMVRTRIDIWLDPFGRSEHMVRSLWAVSAGRLWGSGIGMGDSAHIPVVQSDFIFGAISEELGLVGGMSVLLVYLLILQRGYKIAVACAHPYKKLLATGLMTLFATQSLLIVAGVTGALPLTGITLPFVSYGGSSLLINFILVGILLRMSGTNQEARTAVTV